MNPNVIAALEQKEKRGLTFDRRYTKKDVKPFDALEWELRDAQIKNERGEVVFEQKAVEIPKGWSQTAVNVVVSKYFRGKIGTPQREHSVKQMITRVSHTIADWGRNGGYFASEDDAQTFEDELTHMLVNQMCAFNSPVWFNVGFEKHPQCSACFIIDVQDDMKSILDWYVKEGMIFKGGSGSGLNVSTLRSAREHLTAGGTASGPLSFMKAADSSAGVIKSGGKTRRAAKMVVMNMEHPDIAQFIKCKADEEKKAWALIDAGYDGSFNIVGGAYDSVAYQNANHSVRATDQFMRAVLEDGEWKTRFIKSGEVADTYKAKDLMNMIADSAWICADPGMQFDTTINRWHTSPNSGRINASNPCSEYMFLDNTACNLASLNLMKFRKENKEFDVESFKHASDVLITAMEILVGYSSYPTPEIAQNSFDFRPLGIGYANLGALLMSRGMAYDSDEGRNFAAAITSLMSGWTYRQSSIIARELGPFKFYKVNEEPFLNVMRMHRDASYKIPENGVPADLLEAARNSWDEAYESGSQWGFKNSQISVLAPTGTIAFLMDCDTTGIEPDIALVKYKWLVGGGMMKIINKTVPEALGRLGYSDTQRKDILSYIEKNDTIEGAPHVKTEHLAVFDCAFKPAKGKRSIPYVAHIKMMAAVQPFISGAISKTVNMPPETTAQEIADTYIMAWKLGLKAIAIYRDGSKRSQPLTTALAAAKVGQRRRMPDERQSVTHKFNIGGQEGYITVGLFEDGQPGELFITISKEGSTLSGIMDAFATSISIGLQYGVPLKTFVSKYIHARFEPSGLTNNKDIRMAKSIVDYIFRWMAIKFLHNEDLEDLGLVVDQAALKNFEPAETKAQTTLGKADDGTNVSFQNQADAPPCWNCGAIMVRNGSCYKCWTCGSTSGCS